MMLVGQEDLLNGWSNLDVIVDADPEQSELLVVPVKDNGEAPVWAGELLPVPIEVALEVGRLEEKCRNCNWSNGCKKRGHRF